MVHSRLSMLPTMPVLDIRAHGSAPNDRFCFMHLNSWRMNWHSWQFDNFSSFQNCLHELTARREFINCPISMPDLAVVALSGFVHVAGKVSWIDNLMSTDDLM